MFFYSHPPSVLRLLSFRLLFFQSYFAMRFLFSPSCFSLNFSSSPLVVCLSPKLFYHSLYLLFFFSLTVILIVIFSTPLPFYYVFPVFVLCFPIPCLHHSYLISFSPPAVSCYSKLYTGLPAAPLHHVTVAPLFLPALSAIAMAQGSHPSLSNTEAGVADVLFQCRVGVNRGGWRWFVGELH